jgi:hypothetical protein
VTPGLLVLGLLAPGGDLPGVSDPVVEADAPDAPPSPPPSDDPRAAADAPAAATEPEPAPVGPGEYRARYAKPPPDREAIERQNTFPPREKPKRRLYSPPGSPQRFMAEVKLGPYLPDVDRRYDGTGFGPYAEIFGQTNDLGVTVKAPKPGVTAILGFEWQFFYLYGPLSLGVQVGFFRDKAQAILAAPDPGENIRSQADRTTFGALPIALLVGYRFAYLADRFKVPIVPYARGGVAYGFWWSKDGSKKIASNDAGKASGGSWGWQVNAGAMLRLDWLEPGQSKSHDRLTGVNHFSIFGEYQLSRLDGFGTGRSMNVGASTWLLGFGVEF